MQRRRKSSERSKLELTQLRARRIIVGQGQFQLLELQTIILSKVLQRFFKNLCVVHSQAMLLRVKSHTLAASRRAWEREH